MKCLKCQAELPGGAKFCRECGNKVKSTCPQCGKTIPSESKFCIECGHDLRRHKENKTLDLGIPRSYTPKHLADKTMTTRSFIEGERKIVTVMFADVTNSTAMFGELNPETGHDIMDRRSRLLYNFLMGGKNE
jgi:ribosomal protein L40E